MDNIGNPSADSPDLNTVAVLKERLPKDMFISPNSITVSSIIGQGKQNIVQLVISAADV